MAEVGALLKWAGGKRDLIPEIRDLVQPVTPRVTRYLEPFVGAGTVYLRLADLLPRHVVLADVNDALVSFHRFVRDAPDALVDAIRAVPSAADDGYATNRARFNALRHTDPECIERAALLYWLNKTCFNGLYRENRAGEFNTPRGAVVDAPTVDPDAFRGVAAKLPRAHVLHLPFEVVLGDAGAGDLVYLDPPYDGTFTSYAACGFGPREQSWLAGLAGAAADRGAAVVASNADTPAVRAWWEGFAVRDVTARRSIAASGDRGRAHEVLLWRFP